MGCDGDLDVWISQRILTIQMCAEECKEVASFKSLIEYGREGTDSCDQNGCDCKCIISPCNRLAKDDSNLYEVVEGELRISLIYFFGLK